MRPVETYLSELRATHRTGAAAKETSYYPALVALLNEIGGTLKPKVRCVLNPRNQGAGIPDGGLYEATQFQRATGEPATDALPARGCIEVKGTGAEVERVAASAQVQTYLRKYRQVLVTNYRSFLLLAYDEHGRPVTLERYDLAASEAEFWAAAPHALAQRHGARLVEYLKRVMLHAAELVEPEQLAWFLASYARDAKARVEDMELPALANVRAALEEALGLRFEGAQGEHFFRSTLVQTLFYGVFSAWVLWSKRHGHENRQVRFDWRTASYELHVPMIRALFYQVASPQMLGRLGLVEVLDWTAAVLNRVRRAEFFARFEEGQAVQYFYEPFLQHFDPELRKQLGVWYTPAEIVQYMVARVDTVLREELNIADGLADERVYVLDPCCGTGAYLVEVLRRINATLTARDGDALSGHYLKEAATKRVFGFEILPAPFVVAHLQLGLLLQTLGAPLDDTTEERASVYLTNALTGWEPPKEPKTHLLFPELEAERDAAERVKRETPILVILGNPPYNAFAGTSPEEEQGLVEPYKEGLIKEWGIKKFNLDDLYVRFFRLAERRVAETTGKGVVSFISNHSWVSDPSFVVLRQHLLQSFDKFWIENMHGNRKISEYAPDGRTSETIFAIPGFSPGIQQGVAISLWVKTGRPIPVEQKRILFRDDLNAAKAAERRKQLLESLKADNFDAHYEAATPARDNRFSFRPADVASHYKEWPSLAALCTIHPFNGPVERRGFALIAMDRDVLLERMRSYFDRSKSDADIEKIHPSLMMTGNRIVGPEARKKILKDFDFDQSVIVKYPFKPFDVRWCYLENLRPLFSEPSPQLLAQRSDSNAFLIVRETSVKEPTSPPLYYSPLVCDYHLLAVEAKHIPFFLNQNLVSTSPQNQRSFFPSGKLANLSPETRTYLATLGINNPDTDEDEAALIWMHALAIGYSPAYLRENADGIRGDWPRVPLPSEREALLRSAALGRRVAELLDTERAVAGVTTGTIDPFLHTVAKIQRVGGGKLNPAAGELEVNAGWGHAGKGGVTMPGKGRIAERPYSPAERAAIAESPLAIQLTDGDPDTYLGASTHDVYLNDVAYWQNVPARVWAYTIGGYQVIKKWLSYREHELLKRALTADEAREVTHMARRIAALCLLEPLLDDNYAAVKAATYTWPANT
ncbi:MAG TPA: type ISP restriction/modification enzyme [Pyrinomonadaceae bacterium]|jgi:hypothetical protein